MKRALLSAAMVLMWIVPLGAQNYSRAAYIEKYWRVAVEEMHKTGIPASITLAQACLESADGNSYLATKANNHFGIKCHNWTGATVRKDDDRKNECFRSYDNPIDSYRDHSDFLKERQRYSLLFDLEPTDYEGWAYGLSQAGYATDPRYPQLLIGIIEEYRLHRFDVIGSGEEDYRDHSNAVGSLLDVRKDDGHMTFTLERYQTTSNGARYIVVSGGETIRSIAAEFNLRRAELMRYNDMKVDVDKPIKDGTIIYLSKKKNKTDMAESHVVEKGETLWMISQKYAMRLKVIYRKNRMDNNTVIMPGDVIKLR